MRSQMSLLSLAAAACATGAMVVASSCGGSGGGGFGADGGDGSTTTGTTTGTTTLTTTGTATTTTTGTATTTTTGTATTTTTGTATTTTGTATTTTTGTATTTTTGTVDAGPCVYTSSGGMALTTGMSAVGAGGYAYAFSDATKTPPGGSSACVGSTNFCGHGVSAAQVPPNYSDPYGGGIGINLNGAALPYTALTGSGVTYTLSSVPVGTRLVIGNGAPDYCYNVPTSALTGTVPWASFTLTCYDPDAGAPFSPSDAPTHIEVEVVSPAAGSAAETWDLCATLGIAP